MPSTKFKWGNWIDLPPDRVRVNWGGWVAPRLIYVKDQDGVWRDTGYHSAPNPPINFGVASWDYGTVNLSWAGPAGAAGVTAPAYYEYVMTDPNGNWYHNPYTTTGGSASYGVSPDTRYRFYVRSVSPKGLRSAWNGPVNVGIGHPQQTAQRWAQRSRSWQGGPGNQDYYAGSILGPTPPGYSTAYGFATGVVVTDLQYIIWSNVGFTSLWGFLRTAWYLWNDTAGSGAPTYNFDTALPSGPFWAAHPLRGNWSNGGHWGMWLDGQGYGTQYGVAPITAYITVVGTEYYPELETYVSVAATGNYYW